MPLTPEDVSNKRFTPVRLREGYDMGEVDQFLDEVETELTRLTRENQDLRSKLSGDGAVAPATEPAPAVAGDEQADQDEALAAEPAPAAPTETIKVTTVAEASSAATRLLELATRNADELVGEARQQAEQIVEAARADAERLEADARTRSQELESETAERRQALLGEIERDKESLAVEVENLRSYEREYRARLKSYFEQQLASLDSNDLNGSPEDETAPRRVTSLLTDDETPS